MVQVRIYDASTGTIVDSHDGSKVGVEQVSASWVSIAVRSRLKWWDSIDVGAGEVEHDQMRYSQQYLRFAFNDIFLKRNVIPTSSASCSHAIVAAISRRKSQTTKQSSRRNTRRSEVNRYGSIS